MDINKDFFDHAASFYNDMINFDDALTRRISGLKNFVAPNMYYGADIGCGTGIDSIALEQNGIAVTAFDTSGSMIEQARHAAEQMGAKVEFHQYSADKIPQSFYNKFQIVVSLGNTFANLNKTELEGALNNCFQLLSEGGILLIQILNFRKILKDEERIVSISKGNKFYYIRFYDFMDNKINFNILKFEKEVPVKKELITTTLYPHKYESLTDILMKTGFTGFNLYENFDRKEFRVEESKDLIIEAKK